MFDSMNDPPTIADAEIVDVLPPPAPLSPAPAPCELSPENVSPNSDSPRGGAPAGNGNALRHGHRGHHGSTLCRSKGGLAHEYQLVNEDVKRVLGELQAQHLDWPIVGDELQLPAAVDAVLMGYRRACERDRVAAKLLRDLKDLKGKDLTHADQVAQREVQAAATKAMEVALGKLGLGLDSDPAAADDNPQAALARFVRGNAPANGHHKTEEAAP